MIDYLIALGYKRVLTKAYENRIEIIFIMTQKDKIKQLKKVVNEHFKKFDALRPKYDLIEKNGVLFYRDKR